jgi:hypothetical protein
LSRTYAQAICQNQTEQIYRLISKRRGRSDEMCTLASREGHPQGSGPTHGATRTLRLYIPSPRCLWCASLLRRRTEHAALHHRPPLGQRWHAACSSLNPAGSIPRDHARVCLAWTLIGAGTPSRPRWTSEAVWPVAEQRHPARPGTTVSRGEPSVVRASYFKNAVPAAR